ERINLSQLQGFYGKKGNNTEQSRASAKSNIPFPDEPTGSNGIAIAPSNSAAHRPLLLINPHTSFFFRAEVQMVSDEGLNAYGAQTVHRVSNAPRPNRSGS